MPTYHYRCSSCGHAFDQFQKFAEDPLTVCPQCEGSIKRVLQPVGVVFKGSGWYITDSRESKSNGKSPETAKPKESDGAAKTEPATTSTETAPKEKATATAAKSSDS